MVEDHQGTLDPNFLICQQKLLTAKGIVLAVPLSRSAHPIIHSMSPVPKQLSRMNDFQSENHATRPTGQVGKICFGAIPHAFPGELVRTSY